MSDNRVTTAILAVFLLLMLIPLHSAEAQESFEYKVQIRGDGSAYWSIEQYSTVNSEVYTWQDFNQIISVVLDTAQAATEREMGIDQNSIQISTSIFAQSKRTEYDFVWLNFSVAENNQMRFGDVFQASDFLARFFGDSELYLIYPENYSVESIYPTANNRDDQAHTLAWNNLHDLINENTEVVLMATLSFDNVTVQTWLLMVTTAGLAAAIFMFLFFRRQHNQNKSLPVASTQMQALLQTEEDKILNLLKTRGGTMRQSEITEQLHFSKAKTSQLLSALESTGALTRLKKGRDKIVTIAENPE